ncbi:MAG: Asp23/Gls24 family envelope stress response protein [Oscillospiraceae bacterium]
MAENYITKQLEKGTINIAEDVIAVMVSAAVTEVDGVAGFGVATTPELVELFGRKTNTKGLKIRFIDDKVTIDVMVNVKLGGSITDIALRVQEAVCREVESVTGMCAVVNVHVTGVVFDK